MLSSKGQDITQLKRFFLEPQSTAHRQYEALRAFIVEEVPGKQAAERFGYTEGSFRLLVHGFRRDPHRQFFISSRKRGRPPAQSDPLREQVIALRKENFSIYDISAALATEGHKLSAVRVNQILSEEGFARLPRRRDEERPDAARPTQAEVADVRSLDLCPRRFRTRFGGLFLFLPQLVSLGFDKIINAAGLPGSKKIPAAHAMRSLLALKLFGSARHSHVMSHVLDEGLALFAGLNAIPKRSFLTEYSCRIHADCYPRLMRGWFDALKPAGLESSNCFDLDFHTIPFHGEEALMQKHYVSKRSRRQKGVLAFLAQDASTRVFCYANADLRKETQSDEVLQFVNFWKARTGSVPEELIFDSKLTSYTNLSDLNQQQIRFITLRRRSRKMLAEVHGTERSAWRRIELDGVGRMYRTPRILDRMIRLRDYEGPLRELVITDLGHEEPTFLITNQLRTSASKLITRYAQRMLIENNIADGIDFFHMDALSSAVAMKVNCDLQITLMASSLYRFFAAKIGNGYQNAKSRHLFRDFIDATATVDIDERAITVLFQKRAHNPLLTAAGFDRTSVTVPWLCRKRLSLVFG